MKKPEELTAFDFPDLAETHFSNMVAPETLLTVNNFQKLIDEHNNLTKVVNAMLNDYHHGVKFDD